MQQVVAVRQRKDSLLLYPCVTARMTSACAIGAQRSTEESFVAEAQVALNQDKHRQSQPSFSRVAKCKKAGHRSNG